MSAYSSRRTFLQAGLALPAAGLVVSSPLSGAAIPSRTLGKTGLKVAPVGFGVGFTPDPSVIARALEVNKPDPNDGLDVLAKVGGCEIGGLAGLVPYPHLPPADLLRHERFAGIGNVERLVR